MIRNTPRNFALRIVLLIGSLIAWEGLVRLFAVPAFVLPAPSAIFVALYRGIASEVYVDHLWVTLSETLLGFFFGCSLAFILGTAVALSRRFEYFLYPFIVMFQALPKVALAPLILIWFGLGLGSKVALAVVLVFFVVFFNAFQGVREVDRNLLANARILGASPRRITSEVIIPSALSWIIASLHTSFGFALVGAVVGEYLGAIKGLGLMIATAQNTFNPNGVFAAMAILAAVALLAEAGVTALENRLISWRPNVVADVTI